MSTSAGWSTHCWTSGRRAIDAFFDTSALFKRYRVEPGSGQVISAIAEDGISAYVSALIAVEASSAISRLEREGRIDARQRQEALADLDAHIARDYAVIQVSPPVVRLARGLVQRRALRTLDACQLASALAVRMRGREDVQFWTADGRQAEAAEAEGFEIVYLGA